MDQNPNPIKCTDSDPDAKGSKGKYSLVKHILKGKIHLRDNKYLPKKLLKTVLQSNEIHL